MSDIIERLKRLDTEQRGSTPADDEAIWYVCESAIEEITRLRAALAAQQPPPGWRLVPCELHMRMSLAMNNYMQFNERWTWDGLWKVALAAAPQPGEQ